MALRCQIEPTKVPSSRVGRILLSPLLRRGLELRNFDAVSSPGFGAIQSRICCLHQSNVLDWSCVARIHRYQPHAEGDGNWTRSTVDRALGYHTAQSFRTHDQALGIASRNNDQEFFPSIAADRIIASHRCSQSSGNFCEHGISNQVAVRVIDILEVIDVRHDYTQRLATPLTSLYLALQKIQYCAPVPHSGQMIVQSLKP